MPPAKTRLPNDDLGSSAKERLSHSMPQPVQWPKKRSANHVTNGSSLKAVMNSASDLNTKDQRSGGSGSLEEKATISWPEQDIDVLHNYRNLYHIDSPSAFSNPLGHVILSRGIGPCSPTMARSKIKRRVSKNQLATAVRKSFNASAINETDVLVGFMYKVKMQDRSLRVRFAPQRK